MLFGLEARDNSSQKISCQISVMFYLREAKGQRKAALQLVEKTILHIAPFARGGHHRKRCKYMGIIAPKEMYAWKSPVCLSYFMKTVFIVDQPPPGVIDANEGLRCSIGEEFISRGR